MGRHLVDLLVIAVEAERDILASGSSSVRAAHLYRAEHFIGARLSDCRLLPTDVAARRNTDRSVSAVAMARAENRVWPPRVVRGSAFQAAIAASVN